MLSDERMSQFSARRLSGRRADEGGNEVRPRLKLWLEGLKLDGQGCALYLGAELSHQAPNGQSSIARGWEHGQESAEARVEVACISQPSHLDSPSGV